jgi:hypothetical protein
VSSHVINKLSFLIPAPGYDEARVYQRNVKDWSAHHLPALISHHLDEISPAGEVIVYDKIEIEISQLPWNLSADEWNRAFAKSIRKVPVALNTLEIVIQQWFFYLKNGCFKRDSVFKTVAEIEQFIFSMAGNLGPTHFAAIAPADLTSTVLQRIFMEHSKGIGEMLLEQLWQLATPVPGEIYEMISGGLKARPMTVTQVLQKLLQAAISRDSTTAETLFGLVKNGQALFEDKPEDQQTFDEINPAVTDLPFETNFIDCPNAGLVLLFPFLENFFKNCNLVQNDSFVDQASEKAAIQSLHFLATGEPNGSEGQLVLPKILCGTNVDEYLLFTADLPAAIKTEAEELLQSVIGHWDRLRNTSIDGLRETFIRRGGKLSPGDDSWTLQVEAAGVDILLDSLPWGFRNYRLPWMKTNLVTEWY